MRLTRFKRIDSANDLRPIRQSLLCVEGAMFSGHALDEDSGVFVDENVGFSAWSVDAP